MRSASLLGLVVLVVATAGGCTDPAAEGTAAPASADAASSAPATPPSRRSAGPTPSPTQSTTPSPVTVDGPCPYADATTIAETVGQRIARTTVTRTSPYVGCGYHRATGEKAVDIAVSVLASPAAAQDRAIAVAGPAANPVDAVGDGGAAAVTGTGTVLGVSKDSTLVVIRINQRISLEAVEIAKLVVAGL